MGNENEANKKNGEDQKENAAKQAVEPKDRKFDSQQRKDGERTMDSQRHQQTSKDQGVNSPRNQSI